MPALTSPTAIDRHARRKRWLKNLASARAASWKIAVLNPRLDGITRLETTREILHLEDGVCVAWSPIDESRQGERWGLVGTRLVAWLTRDHRVVDDPVDDARALFWRADMQELTIGLAAPMRSLVSEIPLTALTGTMPSVTRRSGAPSSRRLQPLECTRYDRRIGSGLTL